MTIEIYKGHSQADKTISIIRPPEIDILDKVTGSSGNPENPFYFGCSFTAVTIVRYKSRYQYDLLRELRGRCLQLKNTGKHIPSHDSLIYPTSNSLTNLKLKTDFLADT